MLCNFKKEKMIHKERLKTTAWLHLYAHWGKLLFVFSLNIHNKTCGLQYFKFICVLWKAFDVWFLCLIFLNSNPYIGLCSGNLCYNMVEQQSYTALHNDLYKPLYKPFAYSHLSTSIKQKSGYHPCRLSVENISHLSVRECL